MRPRPGPARAAALALLAWCAVGAPRAAAQTEEQNGSPRTPAVIRIGKWAALGLATGLTAAGAVVHDRADGHYGDLLDFCRTHGPCPLDASGRYANAGAETLYQRVVQDDRTARRWLIGGQAALLASAALFVLELSRKGGPENIPFSPYLSAGGSGTKVGLRLAW